MACNAQLIFFKQIILFVHGILGESHFNALL